MKKTVFTKVISAALTIAMLLGSVQLTAITAFAKEHIEANSNVSATKNAEIALTSAEAIEKEMAGRHAITKDRSAISANSQAAVYVDGVLYKEGGFSEMWNVAMDRAAYADTTKADVSNYGRSTSVEYVLNMNFRYNSSWFSEKTMTVANKIFTIDLNGHILERFDDNGSVIIVKDNSVLTIMDSNPTFVNAGNIVSHNMWSPMPGGSFKIKGGVITGGYLKTGDGGGLSIDGNSIVYMTGGTIAGNKADVGAGVYLDNGSILDMSRGTAQICYNYCAGTSTDGGAVFLRSDCSMIGGYVHHNLADDYGGGVRAKGGNISINNVVIYANKAEEYGGGLYIECSNIGQTVTISGCKVVENYAPLGGGGAYIYDVNRANMVSCIIENNLSDKNGGGIFVNGIPGVYLAISGKMIVRDNYEATSGQRIRSNLYLSGDDDLIVDGLSMGSEVWVKTGTAPSSYYGVKKPITSQITSTSQFFFFSDVDGYVVKYQDDPAKANYRHLYLEKGAHPGEAVRVIEDFSTKVQPTPYTVESGAYKGTSMPLYKGYFEFNLMTAEDFYSASPFYYSDGYFLEDPTVYNTHLATMSINLAVAAFGRYTDSVGDNAYANHFANVKQLFSDIGCLDVDFFANEDYQIKPAYYGEEGRLSTIAVAISQKKIEANGETYTLVPIAIRGGSYESEWSSNATIGEDGEAKGFADAANQVFNHVQNYLADYGLTEAAESGKVKFWVVGYSRAGATANLTSKRLVDGFASKGNQIFGYTFEAPMGGVKTAIRANEYNGNGTYPTIHNTINENDFVTLVAPYDMGFMRYGVDHLIGSDYNHGNPISYSTTSAYYKQRMKMVAQLNAINPYYKFNDSWQVADINIILGNLPIFATDMIDKGEQIWDDPNPEVKNISTLLPWFYTTLIGYGFMLPSQIIENPDNPDERILVFDMTTAREKFSEMKPLATIAGNNKSGDNVKYSDRNLGYSNMSLQQSAASLLSMVMAGLTDEQMNEILVTVMANGGLFKSNYLQVNKWDQNLFNGLNDSLPVYAVPVNAIFSVLAPICSSVSGIFDVYDKLINEWDEHSELEKAQLINWLMHELLDSKVTNKSVWEIVGEENAKILAEALPVILWFVLNYASMDYNETEFDDGMWAVGTFVNNASTIISNHYQDVSVAWVRSYDRYYDNDLQAYKIDADNINNRAPSGSYAMSKRTLTLSAEDGSSIFYSIDGGNSWTLYTKPVSLDKNPNKILCFSIYHGAKSDVKEISMNAWAGSILGGGNVWFLIVGAAAIVGASVAIIEVNKKRKKAATKN